MSTPMAWPRFAGTSRRSSSSRCPVNPRGGVWLVQQRKQCISKDFVISQTSPLLSGEQRVYASCFEGSKVFSGGFPADSEVA